MHKEEIASVIVSYIIISVIVIGAIIFLFFLVKPAKLMAKNRDSERLMDLSNLETSINLYLADDKNFDDLKTGLSYDSRNGQNSISGSGWLPLNFRSVSGGVPILELPLDPKNDAELYYQVGINVANKTYEINCRFEDKQMMDKYLADGGNSSDWYEIGTDLSILQ